MSVKKFNYTSGEEYKLNGLSYEGYFNSIGDGNIYAGKKYDSNLGVLTYSKNKLSIDYDRSNYFKDRLVFDELELPYSLEQILIQPNEIVSSSSLNVKFKYIHENLLYVYSKMFFGDTKVPTGYSSSLANYLYNKNFNFDWANNINYAKRSIKDNPIVSKYSEFDKIKKFISVPFTDDSGISLIGISDTHVIGLTSNYSSSGSLTGAQFVLYTNYIDNNTMETYQKLEDITYDGEFLYITDSQINDGGQVFKYNINSFYSENLIFDFKKYLLEPIGGIGGYDRYNKFNSCTTLGCKKNELWVFDSGNQCIKIYDGNFVFKKTLKVNDYKILDIRYRQIDDCMYILYEKINEISSNQFASEKSYGLFGYNSEFELVYKCQFEDLLDSEANKTFKRFEISQQDSNVFYVLTDTTVFKKFFTNPNKSFAAFNRENFYINSDFIFDSTDCVFGESNFEYLYNEGQNYSFFNKIHDLFVIGHSDKSYEDLFLVGNSFLSHFKEYTKYESLLRNYNLNYYNYNDILLERDEYVQSFVFNKEIFKIYSNIVFINNNLRGRFKYEYDKYSELNRLSIMYLTDSEIDDLKFDINYNSYINDNELLNANVINRIFSKIYELHTKLLTFTKVKIKNLKTAIKIDGSNIWNIS